MKKFVAILAVVILLCSVLVGCSNRQVFDATYNFDRAIICLPDGQVIEGKVTSWRDYDGDQLQVKIDGKTYLTHSVNVVLIAE